MKYDFVLVPDCTKHFYKCLKYRASEASEEKNSQVDLH